ncbi:MAG: hypothetical protein FWD90_13985 [Defluviitaleaceae bacterium]|nr:hypothetical protein [Defluviitaleaceae bacterium]
MTSFESSLFTKCAKSFWDGVIKKLGSADELKRLSREVCDICPDISDNAITEAYKKKSIPGFFTGIAIAAVLRVSPFELGIIDWLTKHANSFKNDNYLRKRDLLETLFHALEVAFGIKISYTFENIENSGWDTQIYCISKIYDNLQSIKSFNAIQIRCENTYCINSIFLKNSRECLRTVYKTDEYYIYKGSIYPKAAFKMICENEHPIYDFVDKFIVENNDYRMLWDLNIRLKEYSKNRYAFGLLGNKLSPSKFFWLQYILGHLMKTE